MINNFNKKFDEIIQKSVQFFYRDIPEQNAMYFTFL